MRKPFTAEVVREGLGWRVYLLEPSAYRGTNRNLNRSMWFADNSQAAHRFAAFVNGTAS